MSKRIETLENIVLDQQEQIATLQKRVLTQVELNTKQQGQLNKIADLILRIVERIDND